MMTKKRTSSLASVKILVVVPVVGIVFLAVSAFKEIPNSYIKQLIPEISALKSTSESTSELMPPPPPPPPPSSESNENKQVAKEELTKGPGYEPLLLLKKCRCSLVEMVHF